MDNSIQASAAVSAAPTTANIPGQQARSVAEKPEPPAPAVAEKKAEASREAIEAATRKVQQFVETRTSELQFSIDESTGMQVVRVLDRNTQELIRQIPNQEIVDMAVALERIQGLLLKQKA